MNKLEILKKYFGYDSLREGQEELIESILSGRDTLGIMPTGAGKSLCYQLPAIMMSGITIVISPLISLMTDQVKALREIGVRGAYINSSLTERQISKALENAMNGMYKIIYIAPERLETQSFLNFATTSEISMVTIDEAHCVSHWGQDFRPSYMKISDFIKKLSKCPVVSAFTATATDKVKEDIINILELNNPQIKITGFDRKNLFFKVEHINRQRDKNQRIINYISEHPDDSGIIYCATRKNVDNVWEVLNENGIKAGRYHAGMSNEERKSNQEDFIYDTKPVIVATNAFGMGIDKSNVRYVIHYNMPQSMENYYQEAGRAGRDGEDSECILIYSPQDIVINRFLLESKTPEADLTFDEINQIKANDDLRLKRMTRYCTTSHCLRNYILTYFGESISDNCENCGNCLAEFEKTDITEICKDIIFCINEMKGRYGLTAITDTLLGRNTERVRKYNLDKLLCFSKQQDTDETTLKSAIEELESYGYIKSTGGKYPTYFLTETSYKISEENEKIILRTDKSKTQFNGTASKRKRAVSSELNPKGNQLFEILRKLRLEIAQEEKVPPYIIFGDKTLKDMCVKLPFNKTEMLNVNGIGENKYEKYGELFINAIKQFTNEIKEILYSDLPIPEYKTSTKTKKCEFHLTEEIENQITYGEKTYISEFIKHINSLRDETSMKTLSTKTVTQLLVDKGYLYETEIRNQKHKLPTEKGMASGISTEKRFSEKIGEYEVVIYNESAQKLLVSFVKELPN